MEGYRQGKFEWTGELYLAYYDAGESDFVQISGTSVKYGVAREGETMGDNSWEK